MEKFVNFYTQHDDATNRTTTTITTINYYFIFTIYKLMKYRKILLKYNTYFHEVIFSQVKYKIFYISLTSFCVSLPRDITACQTFHNKM